MPPGVPESTHTRKHTYALLFVFLFVIVIGGGVLAATILWSRIGEEYKGYSEAATFVEIPPGSGPAEIRRRLIDAGVVADEYTFRYNHRNDAKPILSGRAGGIAGGSFRGVRPTGDHRAASHVQYFHGANYRFRSGRRRSVSRGD